MSKLLRCLFLEDNDNDAVLVRHALREVATVEVARNEQSFRALLKSVKFDVILVDFALPGFSGGEAISLAKQLCSEVPVIICSGSINDLSASAYLRSGASDYLLKDRLGRLPEAVLRAHENQMLRRQAMRDNRLELVGNLQSGFSHDLRNLLQVFVSGTDILRKLVEERLGFVPDDMSRVLSAMASTGARGTDMSNQINAFIRGSNGNALKSVRPEYLLTELGSIMRESFPKDIRLSLHTVPGTSPVKCNATQVMQVLMNLVVNAKDEMAHGGELYITAQNATFNPLELPGDFVVFQVRDTGKGIPAEHLPHIWTPFYTSKPVGKGTGLGLSMAQQIARDHGGDIDVKTGTGGTSFFVYLPVAVGETRAEAVVRMGEFDGEGRKVLIVDDEAHMRMLVEMFLLDANYKSLVACSAMEALSLFRSNADIEVLLSDVAMPVMSGQRLAEALREQNYTLPIVFMTGATDAGQFNPAPDAILHKPFSRDELLKTLAGVLTAPALERTLGA